MDSKFKEEAQTKGFKGMPQEKTESGEKLVIKIIKSKGTKV